MEWYAQYPSALSNTYMWVLELRDVRDDGQALSEVSRGEVVLLQ